MPATTMQFFPGTYTFNFYICSHEVATLHIELLYPAVVVHTLHR